MTKRILFLFFMWTVSMSSQKANELAIQLESIDQIKKETIGGKLDFEKILENDGTSGFYLRGSKTYSREDYATYLWGLSARKSGIKTVKKALKLWTEIKGEKPNKYQKKGLKDGFTYLDRYN